MDIEKLLNKDRIEIEADEADIQAVTRKAKMMFLESESKKLLSYHEFIWNQFRMIRKRWWVFQFAILYLAWLFLSTENEAFYVRRGMGVFAALFAIILIPELWRNLSNRCVEIEIASYYSLHQIYAARILLFSAADVLLLTGFLGAARCVLHISLADLITQFLLPMVVTACICFVALGRQYRSGWIAIALCILWSGVWWAIAANDPLYSAITLPIWIAVFAIAFLFLAFSIYRLLKNCNKYMEVNLNGTVFE